MKAGQPCGQENGGFCPQYLVRQAWLPITGPRTSNSWPPPREGKLEEADRAGERRPRGSRQGLGRTRLLGELPCPGVGGLLPSVQGGTPDGPAKSCSCRLSCRPDREESLGKGLLQRTRRLSHTGLAAAYFVIIPCISPLSPGAL